MKLGSVANLYKRNKIASKKIDDDAMVTHCVVIVFFPIYGQFGAINPPRLGLNCQLFSQKAPS